MRCSRRILVAWGVGLACQTISPVVADVAPVVTNVTPVAASMVQQNLARMTKEHPRLFIDRFGLAQLQQIRQTPDGKAFEALILHEANLILNDPPVERVLEGKRMLTVSRLVLYRMTTLGMAYLLTKEERYAIRGIAELEAVSDFQDWNPSHFLDTAEMTLAVAIGMDWFERELNGQQREKIVAALIEKSLRPSFEAAPEHLNWISGRNNWTQVCHAGLTAGALAVYEFAPELAVRVIHRAIAKIPAAMKASYAPNGAYPEGPSYWMYGTEYQAILIELLNTTLGTDFGFSDQPGFDKTGEYLIAMQAPSGIMFNYGDGNLRRDFGPARLWWIKHFQRPDCYSLWTRKLFEAYLKPRRKTVARGGGHRLLPLAMLWLNKLPSQATGEQPLAYFSGDNTRVPVAMHRSDSGTKAVYLAIKGGSPEKSHCHMDGGSFILEADGVRWVIDLPGENYLKQEQAGVELWNMGQDSPRWSLFRVGPSSHSIIMIDGHRQNVKGKGHIIDFSGNSERQSTLLDLSELYRNDATGVFRRVTLRPDRIVEIHDRISGLKPEARVTWQFCTDSLPSFSEEGALLLSKSKQNMRVKASSAAPVHWEIVSDAELRGLNDSPNPNVRKIFFEQKAPESGEIEIKVEFMPGKE